MNVTLGAVLIVTIIIVIALVATYRLGKCRAKEGYLIYPYLDLVSPGERGQYYAMSEYNA